MQPWPDILALTSGEYIAAAAERGVSKPHALQCYRAVYRTGHPPHPPYSPHVPIADVFISAAAIEQQHADGDTIKFTQRVPGSLETESVILPQRSRTGRARQSLCVSSQVGCAMGCAFCETAQMGLMSNLTAAQIIGQWYAARFALGREISNVVFMGMGEPMDTLDAVLQAVRILTDANGAAVSPARITISTVGRIAGIRRLLNFAQSTGYRRLRLAVSINAPNDEIRSQIMPINRAEPIADLIAVMQDWCAVLRQRVLVEYVLIPGVNDELTHADQLAALLRDVPGTINVIPYNPRRNSPWPAPAELDVDRFVQRLVERGQFVKRRRTLGRPVMAACGQLGNEHIRRRRISVAATQAAPPTG